MTGFLVTASVAPLLAEPSVRSEQVSQLILGEGAVVREGDGEMLRVTTALDDDDGWIAAGYGRRVPSGEMEAWLDGAEWSQGALLELEAGTAIRAPHRARLGPESADRVRLPDGSTAGVLTGEILPWSRMVATARAEPPADWAWREFAGTPYLWGGVTGAGIDCSGLVQLTFLARGIFLPRDTHQQATHGAVVESDTRRPGDVLFFRGAESERIAHAAIWAGDDRIVHSALATGGVTRESTAPGSRAASLLARLVAVRRFE